MSQNKFMHPRNIYKKPPSFKDMAIKYPEFRKFAKPDVSGKITIDFKNPEALRALTKTLLLKDFDLDVDIPITRLIPTLPLRLNYLLWIEDLLDVVGIQKSDYASVSGIDIGTGASCIYPLLVAKQNQWNMIATEIDDKSLRIAERNVCTNNLQHLITVKLVSEDTLLTGIVQSDKNYTFSMCNPPFFSSEHDLDFALKSRSPCRPPPHNGITGDLKELVAPGGEIAFILKMMEESKELGNKVRIYTTMIGQKSSLGVLKLELNKLNVASFTETRFCQGNTTRWGIAWTYDDSFSLQKAYHTPNVKKINAPMSYIVPPETVDSQTKYTVENITERIMDLLKILEVEYSLMKKNKFMAVIDVKAFQNTWSHQRRKKRQSNKPCNSGNNLGFEVVGTEEIKEVNVLHPENNSAALKRNQSDLDDDKACKKVKTEKNCGDLICNVENYGSQLNNSVCNSDLDIEQKSSNVKDHFEPETKAAITESSSQQSFTAPLLEMTIFVRSIASEIHVEFLWKDGSGGRESMHQVLQYVKNKMK